MKRHPLYIIMILIAASLVLGACVGGAGTTTSWPGFTVDNERELAFVANGPQIYAVNLSNGTQKWNSPTEKDNKITFYAQPALTDDGQLIVGSYNYTLYSLNPENGQQNWTFDGAESRYIGGALTNGERIYAPNSDKNLYTLGLEGDPVWSFETEDALWAAPVTDGDFVYLPSMDHRVYALDAENGELFWNTDDLGGSIAGVPVLSPDGLLFVGTFGDELLALDTTQNGKVVWRMPASAWVYSGPAQTGDVLYVGDLDGMLYAIEANSGSIIWKIQPDQNNDRAITDKPLVIDDMVYFTSESGNLFAVEAENGNPVWTREIGGKLYAGPQAAGENILVAPMGIDELLIALDLNGNQVWAFIPSD